MSYSDYDYMEVVEAMQSDGRLGHEISEAEFHALRRIPMYASISGTCMIFIPETARYYRHAGIWECDVILKDGRLVASMDGVHEIIPISHDEWYKSNFGYSDMDSLCFFEYMDALERVRRFEHQYSTQDIDAFKSIPEFAYINGYPTRLDRARRVYVGNRNEAKVGCENGVLYAYIEGYPETRLELKPIPENEWYRIKHGVA